MNDTERYFERDCGSGQYDANVRDKFQNEERYTSSPFVTPTWHAGLHKGGGVSFKFMPNLINSRHYGQL